MRRGFRPFRDPLLPLVRESVGCIASKRITVDGEHVGYMARDASDRQFNGKTSIAELRDQISPSASDVRVDRQQLTYRLSEDSTDAGTLSLYGFVVGNAGYLQLGVYLDRESDVAAARAIVATCRG